MIKSPAKYFVAIITLAAAFHIWSGSSLDVAAPAVPTPQLSAVARPLAPQPQVMPVTAEPALQVSPKNNLAADLAKLAPHLERFSSLQIKVLRSTEEDNQLLALISNPFILRQAQAVLLAPGLKYSKSKNQALEFVLEALRNGDGEAKKVLSQLISDPVIESVSDDKAQQQFQAGLKAEAMFTWSSRFPDQSAYIESLLPGPVSKKIWQNVLAQQDLNSEESGLEP